MGIHGNITSFNAGELSPMISSRGDIGQYASGCKTLENFFVTPYGPVSNRPGTEFISPVKMIDEGHRLRIANGTITPGTEAAGTIIHLVELPEGAIIHPSSKLYFAAGQSASLTVKVGDGIDDDRYLAEMTPGASASVIELSRNITAPYTLPAVDSIFITTGGANLAAHAISFEIFYEIEVDHPISAKCRLLPFNYSTEVKYVLEFGEGYVRFYRDGILLEYPEMPGVPYELESPYMAADLHLVKFEQSADVIFMTHPKYYPRTLSRLSATTFEFKELPMTYPALQDPNTTETTITPSAVTGTITLTASENIFLAGHIGSFWDITHIREVGNIEGEFTSETVSTSIKTLGAWNFTSTLSWTGTVVIQKSFDRYKLLDDASAIWINFRSYSSSADRNFDVSGSEKEDNVYYRIKMSSYDSGTCNYEFRNDNFYNHGIVQITDVTSQKIAIAKVISELGGTTATVDWSEAAWSEAAGYPRAIALYEERLWFAGTDKQPNTIWASRTNEWNNFLVGDLADEGLMFTLTGDVNIIQWILGQNALLIGTAFSEWILTSSAEDKPITSTDFRFRLQSGNGSGYLPAMIVGDTALYVQKNNRKVLEFAYSFQDNKYKSNDLTMLSNMITKVSPMAIPPIIYGITEISYQRQPNTILWAIRADGVALSLTYQRDQSVVGWARHITDGIFESVTVIPGALDDEVYFAVRRTIDGEDVRYIEKMSSREWEDMTDANFADCAIRVIPTAISPSTEKTLCSGLLHLKGETVCVIADGALRNSQVVSATGTITLDAPAENVLVGLPYTSRLIPMPLNIQLQDGTSQFRPTRISNVKIKIYKSIGGKAKAGLGNFENINTRRVSDLTDTPLPPYSGWFTLVTPGGWTEETNIEIIQDKPLPLTVINLSPVFEVT